MAWRTANPSYSQSRAAIRRQSDRRRSALTQCSPRSISFRPRAFNITQQIGISFEERLPQTGSWMQAQKIKARFIEPMLLERAEWRSSHHKLLFESNGCAVERVEKTSSIAYSTKASSRGTGQEYSTGRFVVI
jgi:hypothetical protein